MNERRVLQKWGPYIWSIFPDQFTEKKVPYSFQTLKHTDMGHTADKNQTSKSRWF